MTTRDDDTRHITLARAELAPTGVLRAGINLSNGLLVTSRDAATGDPVGVAPSVAAELARRLGVAVRYEEYANPAALVAAVGGGAEGGAGGGGDRDGFVSGTGEVVVGEEGGGGGGDGGGDGEGGPSQCWDVGLVGNVRARAEVMDFTEPYIALEVALLVSGRNDCNTGSGGDGGNDGNDGNDGGGVGERKEQTSVGCAHDTGAKIASSRLADFDKAGVRIATFGGGAYDLWLGDNAEHATVLPCDTKEGCYDLLASNGADAVAGLRPVLLGPAAAHEAEGWRVLEGNFMQVFQAMAVPKGGGKGRGEGGGNGGGAVGKAYLEAFVRDMKASGWLARVVKEHGVEDRVVIPG